MSRRRLSIVSVGDELLAGAHPDLNAPEISRRLAEAGHATRSVRLVSDDEEEVAAAVRAALEESELVIVTGGLGPTLDDVTRQGIARAVGVGVSPSEVALAQVRSWYERQDRPMPASNERQALMPEGAAVLANRVGTAPGFVLAAGEGHVVSLPGPPPEMRVVLEEEALPWLVAAGQADPPPEVRTFHLFGVPESEFAREVGDWMARDADPRMGCSVKKGVLRVVLRAEGSDAEAIVRLEERTHAFRERFAGRIFSEDDPRLEQVVGRALLAGGVRVTAAESCTAGLVASLLGRVPGISAVLDRTFVTYADRAKVEVLGVEPGLLERHGAVSEEVVAAMARGAARAAGADLALATSGVAGPDGGTAEKPVGTVWFATALAGEVRTELRRYPPGERDWIRTLSARHALYLGLRHLSDAGRLAD